MSFIELFKSSKIYDIDKSELSDNEKKSAKEDLNELCIRLANVGVNSSADLKRYFYMSSLGKELSENILGRKISDHEFNDIIKDAFSSEQEIDSMEKLSSVFQKTISALNKSAYPNADFGRNIPKPHNINLWMEKLREIYALMHRGDSKRKAILKATKDFGVNQRIDFVNWLNFYETGEHMKYKIANNYYAVGDGAFIPTKALMGKIPNIPSPVLKLEEQRKIDEQEARDKAIAEKKEKAESLENKKKSLLSRLNSAEKIFTSKDFHNVFGESYEKWLETLHALKRQIQISNVKNADTISDIITKSINKLSNSNMPQAADILYKIAQPAPPSLDDMSMPGGDTGGLGGGPGGEGGNEKYSDPEGAMKEFISGLMGEVPEDDDKDKKNDDLTVAEDNNGDFIVTGQMAQPAPMPEPEPEPMPEPEPVQEDPMPAAVEEVSEAIPHEGEENKNDGDNGVEDVDDKIDAALKNVDMQDIIERLEYVVNIYKGRIVARELQKIDLMMQSLEIDSYFTQPLSEALNKALDANQYGLTRLQTILSTVRSVADSQGDIADIRRKFLEQQAKKEKEQEDKVKENLRDAPEQLDETNVAEEVKQTPQQQPQPTVEQMPQPEEIAQQPVEVEPTQEGVRV